MRKFWSIFSNEKSFINPILGNYLLNRLGLHVLRIIITDIIYILRTLPFFWLAPREWWYFQKNGIVIINDFLPQKTFDALLDDYKTITDRHQKKHPIIDSKEKGFGKQIANADGFDRNDGGSINRFIHTPRESVVYNAFVRSPRMSRLIIALFGSLNKPKKHFIYELIHGNEDDNPDSQRQMHIDTFHHTFKLWYYIDDIDASHGPMEYIPRSQWSTLSRLKWAYQMSLIKCHPSTTSKGGAFRIDDKTLTKMKYPQPIQLTVSKNTLVLVNTKGFHRRGTASKNTSRRGLYANFRPWAFSPIIY